MSPTVHGVKDTQGIARRLVEARERKGMSQRELARLTPYTAAYISRLESAARTATFDALRSFAHALEVSAIWLETGQDVVELRVPVKEARLLLEVLEPSACPETYFALAAALNVDGEVQGLA